MQARGIPFRMYIFVGIGILFFSTSPILVRLASAAPGEAVAVWRTLFAVAILTPLLRRKARQEIFGFDKKDFTLVIAAGIFLGLHFIAWISSLYHTSVASASVLYATSPVFMAILGVMVLREKVNNGVIMAIIVATFGAAMIALGDALNADFNVNASWGNALALGASLLSAFYMIVGRVVRRTGSWMAYVFPVYLIAACTTVVWALVNGIRLTDYPMPVYGWCFVLALGPQIIGHGSFNYALKYVQAAKLGLFGLTEPVGASLIAWYLFMEYPTPLTFIGMALVLFSVAFVLLRKSTPKLR